MRPYFFAFNFLTCTVDLGQGSILSWNSSQHLLMWTNSPQLAQNMALFSPHILQHFRMVLITLRGTCLPSSRSVNRSRHWFFDTLWTLAALRNSFFWCSRQSSAVSSSVSTSSSSASVSARSSSSYSLSSPSPWPSYSASPPWSPSTPSPSPSASSSSSSSSPCSFASSETFRLLPVTSLLSPRPSIGGVGHVFSSSTFWDSAPASSLPATTYQFIVIVEKRCTLLCEFINGTTSSGIFGFRGGCWCGIDSLWAAVVVVGGGSRKNEEVRPLPKLLSKENILLTDQFIVPCKLRWVLSRTFEVIDRKPAIYRKSFHKIFSFF